MLSLALLLWAGLRMGLRFVNIRNVDGWTDAPEQHQRGSRWRTKFSNTNISPPFTRKQKLQRTEPIFTLVGSRMLRKDRLLKSGRSLLATRRRRRRLYNFLVIISRSLVVGGSLFTLVHLSWQKMLSRSWHHPSSLQHILMLDTNPFLS